MADQTRNYLKSKFDDGERPTGKDFADFIESFINKEDDKVRLAAGNNLSLPAGVILANTAAGAEGTLRFNAGKVEVFAGGVWKAVAGETGAFTPVAGGPSVAFGGGNVGVGAFVLAPTHKFDVQLGNNTGTAMRVRFGNLVIHNGTTNDAAYISHDVVGGSDTAYAVRQDSQGNTNINAGNNARLALMQNNTARLQVSTTGNITMTPFSSVTIDGAVAIGALAPGTPRNLLVSGTASKPGGGTFTDTASDIRVKKDVKSLPFGLKEICKLRPVFYKFNGEAGMPDDGKDYTGLVAQELNEVLPFMVKKSEIASSNDVLKRDLLTYDSTPLTFIMINAIRELTQRVEKLETEIAELKNKN